jgi:ATP-dependent exoDNAse (exonuclease V) beta subunit
VHDLLRDAPNVRDRTTGAVRPAGPRDVAVLCRTNEQCQSIAEALAQLDLPAVVPRTALLDTAEGQLLQAGLRLWIDPGDALAAATLARLGSYASDLQALVTRALAAPGRAAFADDPLVAALLAARSAAPDLDPVAATGAVIDATGLRALCAAWGNTAQRHANLDALRAHATAYADEARASRDAASLIGLLGYFDAMAEEWGWNTARSDRQALQGGSDAVTVSTWHAAKGREWPLTVLFGLESLREPAAFGLHVESAAAGFDLAAPLAGRWLRYWPNPYTTANQRGPVKDAYLRSPEYATVDARSRREALRLLYVGWTRARDRLILAATAGKLTAGLLGTLRALEPGLISEPAGSQPGDAGVSWAGCALRVRVRPIAPATPVARTPEPGEITVGRAPQAFAPARQSPSLAPPLPCTLGTPVMLGPRLPLHGHPDMDIIGRALHGFLAADRAPQDAGARLALAQALLRRHRVDSHLDPADVVAAGTRLWAWLERDLAPTRLHREWPICQQLATGTVVTGTADLVACCASGLAVIDHKSFAGSLAAALERLPQYSGQLAAYAHAITTATGSPVTALWIHLPLQGAAVEIHL